MLPKENRLNKYSAFKATYHLKHTVADALFVLYAGKEKTENEKNMRDNTYRDRKRKRPDGMEEKQRGGHFGKTMQRIRTGRWGQWQDLITEMDGQGTR